MHSGKQVREVLCPTCVLLLAWSTSATAEPPAAPSAAVEVRVESPLNLPMWTGGGVQLWTDEFAYAGWHIQRHALTKHCRLLDHHDVRRAWGSYEQCRAEFDRLRRELPIAPMRKEVVIALHGIGGHRGYLEELCEAIEADGRYSCINVAYASTRGEIAQHAAALDRIINHLEDVDRIHFVAHSMGNIVIRRYFTDFVAGQPTGGDTAPHPKFGRMVMLGPPNQGAEFADRVRKNSLVATLLGPALTELADARRDCPLVAPPCEFGILAGSGNTGKDNPLVDGDDDLLVSIAETRLAGARDFLVLPVYHHRLATDPQIAPLVLRFLKEGHFVSEEKRQPIR